MSLARPFRKDFTVADFLAGFATGLVAGILLTLALVCIYQEFFA